MHPSTPSALLPADNGSAVHPDVARIRSLALVGPAGAGKTSLAEALLWKAGAIASPGNVDRGSTVSDFDPMERRLQHSLNSAVMHLVHGQTRVHLLDTPGAPDFVGQAMAALEAVDTAAIVVDAQAGVQPAHHHVMAWAAERGLCRLLLVNKIDQPGVDLAAVLAGLQAAFGRECLPLNLPAGGGTQVRDCFFDNGSLAAATAAAPDLGDVATAHRALVEQVVEVDAGFVERYLNDGDIDPRELHGPLEQALREGHLIPVCFVSARGGAGVGALLDVIDHLLPNPAEGNPPQFLQGEGAAAQPLHARPDPALHVLAHVFKVTVDPYVGKLGIFRVHQGTVTRDSQLFVGDGRKPFKAGHLFMLQGKEHVEVQRALPGDICAVPKIEEMHFDAVLHDAAEDAHLHLKPLPFPVPVHGLAIAPRRRGDEQRMWDVLHKLSDEDPCLRVEHVAATNQTVVYGLGELHLRTLIERMADLHKCEVVSAAPRIAYRETIGAAAEGHHRHKKQSGGAGQFGEVFLRVEPLPRSQGQGIGFEFIDAVKGGAIPAQFIPAVEKGVRQAMEMGVIAGHPVQDVRVTVHDGKAHSVDSKEIAFVTAARKAFIDAVLKARPTLLEPIVKLVVHAPEAHVGDITGDLAARRGQVAGTGHLVPGTSTVMGLVPLAELNGYQARLNSLTAGQGRYTLQFSHHEPAPLAVQQRLAADFQRQDDEP